MKTVLFPLLMIVSLQMAAQTKMISYKSHSGSAANFKAAMEGNLFDIGESDYGLGPAKKYNIKKLDSVLYVNDSTAVVKYSECVIDCYFEPPSRQVLLSRCKHWNSTSDTLYHPIAKKKKAISSIKDILKKDQYDNPIDSVLFIGFDSSAHHPKKKKGIVNIYSSNRNDKPPFDNTTLWLGAGLLLAITATGLVNRAGIS